MAALGEIVQAQFPEEFEPSKYMASRTGDPAKKLKAAIDLFQCFKMALKILDYHKCRVGLYWLESLPLVVFKLVYGWVDGGGANFLGAFR